MNSIEGLTQQIQELTDLAAEQRVIIDTLTCEKLAAEARAFAMADLHVVGETAKGHLIQQAQQHALEALTQRGTVLDILRHFGCPENDWEALSLIKAAQAAPGAAMPTIKQLAAQLDSDEKWTIAEQQAFAPFLQQFPNESSQGILSLGSAWKHGIAYAQSLAAPLHPLPAEQGAAPSVAVDSIESKYGQFWSIMGAWGNATPGDDADKKANELVKYIDAHIAQTVVAAVEDATKDMVPLSADARSVFLDGFGLLDIAYPAAPQQQAQAAQCPECDGRGFTYWGEGTRGNGFDVAPEPPEQECCQCCGGSGKVDPADAIFPAPIKPVDAKETLSDAHIEEIARRYSLDGSMVIGDRMDGYVIPFARAIIKAVSVAPVAAAVQGDALPKCVIINAGGNTGSNPPRAAPAWLNGLPPIGTTLYAESPTYQQGRAAGIEEAAKLVEQTHPNWDAVYGAIRALNNQGG